MQTPYYKYRSVNFCDPYEESVYFTQHDSAAFDILVAEHVKNLFEELDKLKEEAQRYKEAEGTNLSELAQELEDPKEEVREYEELKAREEEMQ